MAGSLIEARSIGKSFGTVAVFSNLSFRFEAGARCALLGQSGTGKSTLLRILAGLEPHDAGDLWIGERNMNGVASHDRGIGFLFQSSALWPHMTVQQNALFAMERPDDSRVTHLLERLDIGGISKRYPHQISGGQARRAALVRALAPRKPILLLDEPAAHLGRAPIEAVWELILEEAASTGATVVAAVHGRDEAERLGGPVLDLDSLP